MPYDTASASGLLRFELDRNAMMRFCAGSRTSAIGSPPCSTIRDLLGEQLAEHDDAAVGRAEMLLLRSKSAPCVSQAIRSWA